MPNPKKGAGGLEVDNTTPTNLRSTRSGLGTSQPRSSIGGTGVSKQIETLSSKFDLMLKGQTALKNDVKNLTETIGQLETSNKNLLKLLKGVMAKNVALTKDLKKAETTIGTLNDELETQKQRLINDTVEILGVSIKEPDNPLEFVQKLGQAVHCDLDANDVSNLYVRDVPQRKGPPKQKIIVSFVRHSKRMEFYLKCRKFRFSPPSEGAAVLRNIKVVDALTYYKKIIYFEIIECRKKQQDIVKNVWVNDGDVYIRRFGATAPEPVKNVAFVNLIFKSDEQPPINDSDSEAGEDSDPCELFA
jgi:hypothetical protein